MISGKTRSGFAFKIDNDVLNDMELLEELRELDKGDVIVIPSVLERVLGSKKKDLYEHVRTEAGRVPIDALAEELKDIFEASKNLKN